MQLHMILKFGLFVVLLDLLKIFQNLFVQMSDIIFMANQNCHNTLPMGSHIITVSITALTKLIMKPSHTFLLLTPLLLPLFIWLAEMLLTLLRKKSTFNF